MHFIPKAKNWMFREAMPHWVDCRIDLDSGGPVESFSLDGKSATTTLLSSTLYHIFLAFAEILHVGETDTEAVV